VAEDAERSSSIWTLALIGMILLALIGVGLTTARSSIAFRYWVLLVPIYGLLSIGAAWFQDQDGSRWTMVSRQALHWGAVVAAVGLDFYLRETGGETTGTTGLSSLLLLALGSFLSGIYFDRRFMALGLLLGLAVVIMAKIDQYNWLIFAAGILLAAAFAAYHYFWRRSRNAGDAGRGV
jgi:hypothetical protein